MEKEEGRMNNATTRASESMTEGDPNKAYMIISEYGEEV